jgi:hypothetical protein
MTVLIAPKAAETLVNSARQLPVRFIVGGSVATAIQNNPRFSEEAEAVFRGDVTAPELIFGKGLGATIEASPQVSDTGRSGVLHNGIANIVLKGGFVLLGIIAVGMVMIFWDFRWIRDRHAYVCGGLILAAVLVSPFQTFLNTSPLWAINLACLGYLMSVSLKPKKATPPATAGPSST